MIGNIGNNIGERNDLVAVPFDPNSETIMAYLQTVYYHIHGAPFAYPYHADPVLLTAGNGAWNLTGNKIEVIPANTIIKNFDLHWISISNISGIGYFIIDIYSGTIGNEILISPTDGWRNNNFIQEGPKRIQLEQQPANTRISCRLSDSTGGSLNCRVKFNGHVYAETLT